MKNKIKKEDLDYDTFFDSDYKKLRLENSSIARVFAEHKGVYEVKSESGEYLAKITGKQIFNATSKEDYPAVGDFVVISIINKEQAVIEKILPRRTIIKRRGVGKNETQIIATNIDVAFIVESMDRDYNLNRFERYFVIANSEGIKPVFVLNKTDLISKEELDFKLSQIKERFENIDTITTSTKTNDGLENLKQYIKKGKTYCFLGSSGVGKSTLINKLLEKEIIKTGVIGERNNKGKHTTTRREMYFLNNGGIVIDNPGMREIGMTNVKTGIENLFEEMAEDTPKCKYSDCTHVHEPGCEILKKLQSGEINNDRYTNYIKLKKEAEFYEMSDLEKRTKERKFGKFIKTMKNNLKKYEI